MKLPSQSSIAALADTLSLVTLPVTIAAAIFFPQTAEQYRTPLVGLLSLLMAWLFLAGYRRYAQIKQRKDKEPTLPRVLLVGGQQYEAVIEEITQHPLLHREAYIKFVNAVLPASNLVHQVQRADALILMPDFTRVNCRASYELVMRRCETATIPMARYYPAGYAGARATDVHTIPFDTPQGIVNYAAEFLLKRAVDRGRYVESRLRLQRGVSWLLATLTICLAIWAWNNRGELEQYRKLSQLPPAHHQDLAARWRTTGRRITKPERPASRKPARGWLPVWHSWLCRTSAGLRRVAPHSGSHCTPRPVTRSFWCRWRPAVRRDTRSVLFRASPPASSGTVSPCVGRARPTRRIASSRFIWTDRPSAISTKANPR